jgi:hypothetical protein
MVSSMQWMDWLGASLRGALVERVCRGVPGADSLDPVDTQISGSDLVELSRRVYGQYPVFWARYFQVQGDNYRAAETDLFRAGSIRVLPIARQGKTSLIGQALGENDADGNVSSLLRSFPASSLEATRTLEFFFFLDVEASYRFDKDYYVGWSRKIREISRARTDNKVTALPCIYSSQGAKHVWQSLQEAINEGAQCFGAWVARYKHGDCACTAVGDWEDEFTFIPSSVPVLIWQYDQGCHARKVEGRCIGGFDNNHVNPTCARLLLDHLIRVDALVA